jgi:hypothetical protein
METKLDGKDEVVGFTRGDAERIAKLEATVDTLMTHVNRLAQMETKLESIGLHIDRVIKFGYSVAIVLLTTVIGILIKLTLG